MATKTNNKPTSKKKQSDSSAVYQVIIALALLCLGLAGLHKLQTAYSTVGGMALLDPWLPWMIGIGFGACAVCIALRVFRKTAACKAVMPWLIFIFAMIGITALSMKLEYTFGFPMLYFLWAGCLVQYIIYLLYRWEFFLFSLPTAAAGFLFYQYRNGFSFSAKNTLLLLITAIILIGVVWIANNAARNKGQLVIGSRTFRLFTKRYSPFLHYLAAALWVICIPAAIALGSLFSFYCMFAAIAAEFIAAVYYTFQLN